MKRLFLDTAGWMALADAGDPRHEDCVEVRDHHLKAQGILVTTDYVMDETLTLIRMRMNIRAAERWWQQVAGSPRIQWEWIDPERTEKARAWFFKWTDQSFSFTDCTSFVVMRELRIRKALTTDRHFAKAGFEISP